MGSIQGPSVSSGDESLIILQSLLCVLREKNLLTRADIEDLCHKVEQRAASGQAENPLPCCTESAVAASSAMQRLASYIGHRYGGKHGRIAAR